MRRVVSKRWRDKAEARFSRGRRWGSGAALMLLVAPAAAMACATCFGRSDSAMAQGMNSGILFLLAVILSVLGGLAGFFIFLARRASAVSAAGASSPLLAARR